MDFATAGALILISSMVFFLMSGKGKTVKENTSSINNILDGIAGEKGFYYKKNIRFWKKVVHCKQNNIKIIVSLKLKSGLEYLNISCRYKNSKNYKFQITKETVSSRMKKNLGINDILTGDEKFDHEVLLNSSNPLFIHAVCLDKWRERFLFCAESNIVCFKNKSFELYTTNYKFSSIWKYISSMVSMIEEVQHIDSIEDRLLHNISNESNYDVIMQLIVKCNDLFQNDENYKHVLRKKYKSANVDLKIEIAIYLGIDGLKLLTDLIQKEKLEDNNRLRIIELFKNNKFRESIPVLKNIYKEYNNPDLHLSILQAFAVFRDDEMEPFILSILDEGNEKLFLAALEVLNHCGSVEAIRRIYPMIKEGKSGSIRSAVKDTIENIKGKLTGVDKGWLSSVDFSEEEGALSFPDEGPEGRLSIADSSDD